MGSWIRGAALRGFGVGVSEATGTLSGKERSVFDISNIVVWLAVLVIMHMRLVHDEK